MGVPLNLTDIQSGFLSATTFNANNTLIEEALAKALDRTGSSDNAMEVDLDMGLNRIFNVTTDTTNPTDLLTVAAGDVRYLNYDGDQLSGDIDANGFNVINMGIPTNPNDAARLADVGPDSAANLRIDLADNTVGAGSDLIAHTNTTDTVTEALDKRTIYVGSVAELEGLSLPEGVSVEIVGGIRAGGGSVKAGTPPADPSKGVYIILANGNYWERDINGPWNPGWFGIDPASVDNSPAWANMLSLNPPHVHFTKAGTYTFLSSVDHDQDIIVTGNSSVVIDCEDAGFTGTYWTKVSGSMAQIESLGANATKGSRVITFASAPSIVANDLIIIHNPTDFSWSDFRATYKAGEFCKVVSVSGNNVTVAGELYDDYQIADVNIYKVDSRKVGFGGGMKIRGNLSSSLLRMEFCRDSYINNPDIYHMNNSAVSLVRCFNCVVNDPAIHNVGDGGDDYGISIANSQSIKVFGGNVYSRRHPITTGGDADLGNVPCRDIRTIGSTLSNDINSGTHCADFHGNTEDSTYENCEIHGGVTWQGKDNGFINCRIGAMSIGVCIISAEIKGGAHYARGCRLITSVDPDASGRGIVEIGGNGGGITSATTEDATFEVSGGSLYGRNLSATTRLMYVRNRGTTHKVSAKFDGVALDVDNFGEVLLVLLSTGTADSNGFIVDNLKSIGPKQGGKLATITAAYSGFPIKMQKQAGFEQVTTSTGAPSVAGTPVVFRWEYPKTPVVTTSRNNRGYIGNRIGIAYAQPISATGLTPSIATDDATNFSSATTVDLHWQAEIAEI